MPVIPNAQLITLRDQHPHTARVEWFLAIAPYGDAIFHARSVGGVRSDREIEFAAITQGDITSVEAGMTLWVDDSEHDSYNLGRVRVRGLIIHYDSGSTEFTRGETLTGEASTDTGIVVSWTVTGGSWADNDAAGDVYVTNVTGDFQVENLNGSVGGPNMAGATAAIDSMQVAENDEIEWADNVYLTLPGAYGFRELWGKYPRMTEAAGVVDFLMDYDQDFAAPADTVLPPKANAGPPGVAWIDPTTGLASLSFTGDRSYTTEEGAGPPDIDFYSWRFPGCVVDIAPPAANMVLWLDANAITGLADGDPVALWEDQSGAGNDATQGVGADRPTYRTNQLNDDYPAIYFDGTTEHFDLPNGFADWTAGLTWFIVMKQDATMENGACFLDFSNAAHANAIRWMETGGTTNDFQAWDGGNSVTAPIDTDWVVWSCSIAAGAALAPAAIIMYKNGVVVDDDVGVVPANVARTINQVGSRSDGREMKGYIAEIIVYDAILTDAQRLEVHEYLGLKYGGYPTAGTCADPVVVSWDTSGFYYVSLTVTDDTAQAREGTVYVPVWIFEEGEEDPFKLAEISSQDGDTANGWRLALKAFQTNTAEEDVIYHWPDGALVVLFTRTWFGDVETGVGGWCMASDEHYRDNIRFVGWLLGETLKHDSAAGTVEFEAVAHDGIMRLIPGWPFSIEDIDGVPTDWYEVADLNVDRCLHYLLEFYSTVNQVCHVERVDEGIARPVKIQSYSGASLYDQAQGDLLGDAKCLLLSDRQGILYATQDPQFLDAVGRGALLPACHLQQVNPNGQADWLNEIDETKPHRPVTGMVRVGGFAFDEPFLALAPGAAPVQQANELRVDGLIFIDQTEADSWAGLTLTQANLDYPQIPLELVGYWPVFDPAYQEYVELTTTDPSGRKSWAAQDFIVRQVSFDDRVRDGTSVTNLVLEKASDILTGKTVIVPETPTPPSPPLPSPPAPPPPWKGDLTHVILMTTQGIFVTQTFNEETPIWYASNSGLADMLALHDMSFDFAHGSRLFAVGALGAWECQNIWNVAAWAMPLANADAIAMINAKGGVCTPLTCDGEWSCVNCEPTSGYLELIAGGDDHGIDCDSHKRVFYSADGSLASCAVGDDLQHKATCTGGVDHAATPEAGVITSVGGHSLYTYVCAWAAGGDEHRGLSTDGGITADTCGFEDGQVDPWNNNPLFHSRAGAVVFFFGEDEQSLDRSADHGSTWAACNALPHAVAITAWVHKQALCVHNLNVSNLIYCGGGNLQYSDDDGTNWANTPTNVANSVCVAPAMVSGFPEGQAFIVGCSATPWVYLSYDFGNSWQDKTGNLGTWLGVGDSICQIIPVQEGIVA